MVAKFAGIANFSFLCTCNILVRGGWVGGVGWCHNDIKTSFSSQLDWTWTWLELSLAIIKLNWSIEIFQIKYSRYETFIYTYFNFIQIYDGNEACNESYNIAFLTLSANWENLASNEKSDKANGKTKNFSLNDFYFSRIPPPHRLLHYSTITQPFMRL